MLGYEVTRRYGGAGLPDDTIRVHFTGVGRPELRRVPAARHHADARGRRQRLRRQGPLGRPPDRPAAEERGVRRRGERHHRQRGALRRDQRRGVRARHRRRAVRRAQQRRAGGRRGRGRPRLRVHDRRPRRRARPHRPELRGGHERRRRLRARPRWRLRAATATATWSTSNGSTTRTERTAVHDLIARHVAAHRQRHRRAGPRRLGEDAGGSSWS